MHHRTEMETMCPFIQQPIDNRDLAFSQQVDLVDRGISVYLTFSNAVADKCRNLLITFMRFSARRIGSRYTFQVPAPALYSLLLE